MSQKKPYDLKCPKCGSPIKAELYDAVNVKTDAELKQALMANRLNAVTCAQCQVTFRVDKPLLYHDPARRIMIYLIPLGEQVGEIGQQQFGEMLRQLNGALPQDIEPPEVHLVFSQTELVERIFLLDARFNERVIEYVKYLIYSRNPGKVDPMAKALLFDTEDSTEEHLCFVVQDLKTRRLESVLQFERKTYATLCEMFDRDDQTPSLLELFPGPYISARALLMQEAKEPSARPKGKKKE